MDLDGRVALITGGARGQGRAHALALAAAGAKVVVCDIAGQIETVPYPMGTEAELEETAELVTSAGGMARAVVADIRNRADVEKAVSFALGEFGRLDILVANAGICSFSPFDGISETVWQDMVDTNLTGTFHCLQAVLEPMRAQGYGRIVAISSMAGRGGSANLAHYSATKWGVIGLVKCLAVETARSGITVNAVCPSTVATPMVQNGATFKVFCPDIEHPTLEDAIPRFRSVVGLPWCEPDAISRAVLYLVADEGYITGTTLEVSLGKSATSS